MSQKIGVMGMNPNDGGYTQSSTGSTMNSQGMLMSIQAISSATKSFSEDCIIGSGGFGVVYKGQLNGTMIAVKRNRVGLMSSKGNDEFKAEIDVLQKVRHRHLVSLVGYCDDGNEKLLVYGYMPAGTLEQHLFEYKDSGLPLLSWKQRLLVALDVARGVKYLHSLAQESFIHRDLKPSNILLDGERGARQSPPLAYQSCQRRLPPGSIIRSGHLRSSTTSVSGFIWTAPTPAPPLVPSLLRAPCPRPALSSPASIVAPLLAVLGFLPRRPLPPASASASASNGPPQLPY